jgi:hypothetical protein
MGILIGRSNEACPTAPDFILFGSYDRNSTVR